MPSIQYDIYSKIRSNGAVAITSGVRPPATAPDCVDIHFVFVADVSNAPQDRYGEEQRVAVLLLSSCQDRYYLIGNMASGK